MKNQPGFRGGVVVLYSPCWRTNHNRPGVSNARAGSTVAVRRNEDGGSEKMIFPGRLGFICAAFLAVLLCPYRLLAMDKLLIVNGTELTMKPGQTEPFVGYIVVGNDGKIKAIGKGEPPAGTTAHTTYDAKGKFVLPGFISAHSHMSESAFRGLATDQYVYQYPAMTG